LYRITPVTNEESHETEVRRTEGDKLSAEIKAAIESSVTTEVQKQLDRDRVILRDAANIALKIVGAAFALLIAIFTVFGITTWQEIAKKATDYMNLRVDDLVQRSDRETGVKQTLNELVNRAIVSAELTALSRDSINDRDSKTLTLP
jgi:hypothetical protein